MSRFTSAEKKFCGVCKKAGKPQTLYESHYTKSVPGPKGVVVCPTILAAICKSCGQTGHFANSEYCKKTSSTTGAVEKKTVTFADMAKLPVRIQEEPFHFKIVQCRRKLTQDEIAERKAINKARRARGEWTAGKGWEDEEVYETDDDSDSE